jgi:hypothetical protein
MAASEYQATANPATTMAIAKITAAIIFMCLLNLMTADMAIMAPKTRSKIRRVSVLIVAGAGLRADVIGNKANLAASKSLSSVSGI